MCKFKCVCVNIYVFSGCGYVVAYSVFMFYFTMIILIAMKKKDDASLFIEDVPLSVT